jgi:hypothetical protein
LPTIKTSYVLADTKPELWQASPILMPLLMGLYIVALLSLVRILKTERKSIRSLLSLSPLTPDQRPILIYGMLFVIPLTLIIFTGTMKQHLAIRYLIPALPAFTVFMGLLINSIIASRKYLGYALVGMWVVAVGGENLYTAAGDWYNPANRWYTAKTADKIEDYLVERNIKGCYTDNFSSNVLNSLTEERVPFTVFNGVDVYPSYSKVAASSPVQGLLLNPVINVSDTCSIAELIEKLAEASNLKRKSSDFAALSDKRILERTSINGWKLWLISDISHDPTTSPSLNSPYVTDKNPSEHHQLYRLR